MNQPISMWGHWKNKYIVMSEAGFQFFGFNISLWTGHIGRVLLLPASNYFNTKEKQEQYNQLVNKIIEVWLRQGLSTCHIEGGLSQQNVWAIHILQTSSYTSHTHQKSIFLSQLTEEVCTHQTRNWFTLEIYSHAFLYDWECTSHLILHSNAVDTVLIPMEQEVIDLRKVRRWELEIKRDLSDHFTVILCSMGQYIKYFLICTFELRNDMLIRPFAFFFRDQ